MERCPIIGVDNVDVCLGGYEPVYHFEVVLGCCTVQPAPTIDKILAINGYLSLDEYFLKYELNYAYIKGESCLSDFRD